MGRLGFSIRVTPLFQQMPTTDAAPDTYSVPSPWVPRNELQTHAQYTPLLEAFGTRALQAGGAKADSALAKKTSSLRFAFNRNRPHWVG